MLTLTTKQNDESSEFNVFDIYVLTHCFVDPVFFVCSLSATTSVYIVIRLFIRIAEHLIARPKHRKLRRKMERSRSYPEWYQYAAELDQSQKRDRWLNQMDDQTSKRYNWDFIRELIKDMQRARSTEDPILALAVLQQCTRKV
jgi:Domain of unknown function (DUF3336)